MSQTLPASLSPAATPYSARPGCGPSDQQGPIPDRRRQCRAQGSEADPWKTTALLRQTPATQQREGAGRLQPSQKAPHRTPAFHNDHRTGFRPLSRVIDGGGGKPEEKKVQQSAAHTDPPGAARRVRPGLPSGDELADVVREVRCHSMHDQASSTLPSVGCRAFPHRSPRAAAKSVR